MKQVFEIIRECNDVHECACCGRTDIKRPTIEVREIASGDHYIFGPQCAQAACHPWGSLSPKYANFKPVNLSWGDEDNE